VSWTQVGSGLTISQSNRAFVVVEPLLSTVITGFLGAGKTTLLHHLLYGNHGLRIAILVDELGAMSIDLYAIAETEAKFVQLPNGCCCFLWNNNLSEILETLRQQPVPPDYLIVEASGLVLPQDITDLFHHQAGSLLQIDSVITVIDAEQVRNLPDPYTPLVQEQIRGANLVILNKIDLIPSFTLAAVKQWINTVSPGIRTFETSYGQIPLDLLIGIGEYIQLLHLQQSRIDNRIPGPPSPVLVPRFSEPKRNGNVQGTHALHTWIYRTDEPMDDAALLEVLKAIPDDLFRVKGKVLLRGHDRMAQIQIVGARGNLRLQATHNAGITKTEIVAVGPRAAMNRDRWFDLWDGCRCSMTQSSTDRVENYDWIRPQN
jgi:G3E family GTPase